MAGPMLSDLAVLEERGFDVSKIIRATDFISRRQFVFAGDHGTASAYNLLSDPRLTNYFTAIFDARGYYFQVNETEQWVGIIPNPDLIPLGKMKLEETIILLLLALTWQEMVNNGNVGERAIVNTTSADILDRYVNIVGRERMKESRFKEILDEMRRRSLVSFGETDPDTGDFEIGIRPTVRALFAGDAMLRLKRFTTETEQMLDRAEIQAQLDEEADDTNDESSSNV